MVDLKTIEIEFIRPIDLNGNFSRYHRLHNVEVLQLQELSLDLRTTTFCFKCPLRLVRYLSYSN